MYNIHGSTLPIETLSKYKNEVFIETGTNTSGGVRTALQCNFNKVISIEIDRVKQEANIESLKNFINLQKLNLIIGDVIDEFPKVLKELTQRATFFLDSHWDFGVKGKTVCSLDFELDLIMQHSIKNHTILIDDRRCFLPGHHWGSGITEDKIISKLLDINKNYKIVYEDNTVAKNDIIVAYI
jgi:hypothetical protein